MEKERTHCVDALNELSGLETVWPHGFVCDVLSI
jgi:hypothetical protein